MNNLKRLIMEKKKTTNLQGLKVVELMGYLYGCKGLSSKDVYALLQRVYCELTEEQFNNRLSKNEYICLLYYIAKCGLESGVERQLLESIKNSDEALTALISKKQYLNDFIEVCESAQGFHPENKQLLEELLNAGVIEKIPCVNEVDRTEYNHECRRLFIRQMRAVGGNSMFE